MKGPPISPPDTYTSPGKNGIRVRIPAQICNSLPELRHRVAVGIRLCSKIPWKRAEWHTNGTNLVDSWRWKEFSVGKAYLLNHLFDKFVGSPEILRVGAFEQASQHLQRHIDQRKAGLRGKQAALGAFLYPCLTACNHLAQQLYTGTCQNPKDPLVWQFQAGSKNKRSLEPTTHGW